MPTDTTAPPREPEGEAEELYQWALEGRSFTTFDERVSRFLRDAQIDVLEDVEHCTHQSCGCVRERIKKLRER
jgi:hypothetical protein